MNNIVKKNLDDIPECFRQYSNQNNDTQIKSQSSFNELFVILILFLFCSK